MWIRSRPIRLLDPLRLATVIHCRLRGNHPPRRRRGSVLVSRGSCSRAHVRAHDLVFAPDAPNSMTEIVRLGATARLPVHPQVCAIGPASSQMGLLVEALDRLRGVAAIAGAGAATVAAQLWVRPSVGDGAGGRVQTPDALECFRRISQLDGCSLCASLLGDLEQRLAPVVALHVACRQQERIDA